jgi:hypothetical protein
MGPASSAYRAFLMTIGPVFVNSWPFRAFRVGSTQSKRSIPRATDSTITGKVKARFVDANKFNAVHVKVVTEASVVYLLGIVTETEANTAVEIARTTGGVRKVVRIFEYCKPTDPACAPRDTPKAEEPKKK